MFTSTARIPIAGSQVISVRVLLDTQQLVAVMAGGDITVIPLDEGPVRKYNAACSLSLNKFDLV